MDSDKKNNTTSPYPRLQYFFVERIQEKIAGATLEATCFSNKLAIIIYHSLKEKR